MTAPIVVGIVGAESTGKTTLAFALRERLAARGLRVAAVPETLREWCDRHGRTPRRDEQAAIAAEQTRRIRAAAAAHAVVLADTTALMTAVYSDLVFGDRSLYPTALRDHAACSLTLLTALDLPWRADGHQRDGEHVREPVDRRLRCALAEGDFEFAVVAGQAGARLEAALACVVRALEPPPAADPSRPRWRWICAHCGDAECERHARAT